MEYVKSGQELTTGLLNGIIDLASGQNIPTNNGFKKTEKGTLYIENENLTQNVITSTNANFLECKIKKTPKLTERPYTYEETSYTKYVFINLGKNYDTAKSQITFNNKVVNHILLLNENNIELNTIVSESLFAESTKYFKNKTNTGYINTGIEIEDNKTFTVFGTLLKLFNESDKEDEIEYAFVISDYDSVKDIAQSLISKEYVVVINQNKIFYSTGVYNKIQGMIGSQDYSLYGELPVDTQISSLNLSSLELTTVETSSDVEYTDAVGCTAISTEVNDEEFYQLYKFGKGNEITEFRPNVYGSGCDEIKTTRLDEFDGFVIRKCLDYNNTDRGKPELDNANIAYMSFNSLSNYINYVGDTDLTYAGFQDDAYFTRGKSIDEHYSRELELASGGRYKNFFTLYNWNERGEDTKISATLKPNESTIIPDDARFLIRKPTEDGNELKYYQLELSVDTSAYDRQIGDIITTVESLEEYVYYELTSLTGDYWVRGGTFEKNYGDSIGSSPTNEVIRLGSKTLLGTWYVEGSLDVENDITCKNLYVEDTVYLADNTTLNENINDQLVISNNGIIADGPFLSCRHLYTNFIGLDGYSAIFNRDNNLVIDNSHGSVLVTVLSSISADIQNLSATNADILGDLKVSTKVTLGANGPFTGSGCAELNTDLFYCNIKSKNITIEATDNYLWLYGDVWIRDNLWINKITGCGVCELDGDFNFSNGSVTFTNTIKIGNTELTEAQLKSLLALLN